MSATLLQRPGAPPPAADPRVDVIYLAWNRLEFTRVTFECLLRNTDWSRVRNLLVYEDGSTDGTREYLDRELAELNEDLHPWGSSKLGIRRPESAHLSYLGFGSPVRTMLHYLNGDPAERFVKIDNDIAVPPGWLDALLSVSDRVPELEILGMQIGFGADHGPDDQGPYSFVPATHIGGVGLMRSSAFLRRPPMQPAGRFGFTQWQQRHRPMLGWLTPDVYCPQMDLIPTEPWRTLSASYVAAGWQRHWPPYDEASTRFWDWIPGIAP